MAFRVGQKVTLIDDEPFADLDGEAQPIYGVVYTVRGFDTDPGDDGDYIWLVEIVNKPRDHGGGDFGEASWHAESFRPVVDISDLQAIVREQMLGKPRTIAPDKFDKQRIHSAAIPHPQRDAGALPAAGDVPPRPSPATLSDTSVLSRPVSAAASLADVKLAAEASR